MRQLVVIAAALCAPVIAHAAPSRVSSTTPYPGIVREEWTDGAIPARFHVAAIDLTSAEIQLVGTEAAHRGTTTTAAAQALGAVLAVNGDYFAVAGFAPAGLAMGNAIAWPGSSDDATSGFVRFARIGEATTAAISPPAEVIAPADLDPATQVVIGGRPMLLVGGQPPASFDCADAEAAPCTRGPRTAVALSADGHTLWLVVVDGWQAGSIGVTAAELASFCQGALGASDALLLDGGSASTMVVGGALASTPSDGVERAVANHLGVRYGALPKGQVVGFIRVRDVFGGANIPGAVATLDDGRTDTVGADGLFDFPAVTPRLACVTATATGYHAASRCVQVESGMMNYDSIALYPNADFVDAGPGAPDAMAQSDAMTSDGPIAMADAGRDGSGGAATGCCDAGDGGAGSLALALLVLGLRRART
ncbi:MAG: phosphodiester glycosidase family protein [Deltaproteobacteria bacterium]|nr:phosphodiester glycosidase family protein [Deltaproteobacteria bacterium]